MGFDWCYDFKDIKVVSKHFLSLCNLLTGPTLSDSLELHAQTQLKMLCSMFHVFIFSGREKNVYFCRQGGLYVGMLEYSRTTR